MTDRRVTIIGGGVAGLAAALDLAQFDIQVDVIEKSPFAGGHAIRLTCKATDQCVRCGACLVEEKLRLALAHPRIRISTHVRLEHIRREKGFRFELHRSSVGIDARKCNNCGICFDRCPSGAIVRGSSASQQPFFALDSETCSRFRNSDCDTCQQSCPQGAIRLDAAEQVSDGHADAILVATGFSPYTPTDKPYGYGVFENVVTNLELESILRHNGKAIRPSDGTAARRIAFIQCVGSRDQKLNHLWCSRICCGSALRMAGLIKFRQSECDITCFYIDIQTFGRDFESFYEKTKQEIRFVRSIPGDILEQEDKALKVIFADPVSHESCEKRFDLVVLSIGLCPNPGALEGSELSMLKKDDDGFFSSIPSTEAAQAGGLFSAGSATGPMSIAESVASAGSAAKMILNYLGFAP